MNNILIFAHTHTRKHVHTEMYECSECNWRLHLFTDANYNHVKYMFTYMNIHKREISKTLICVNYKYMYWVVKRDYLTRRQTNHYQNTVIDLSEMGSPVRSLLKLYKSLKNYMTLNSTEIKVRIFCTACFRLKYVICNVALADYM